MRWGKTTLRWVEYQQGTWPSPQKAKQPDLGRSRGGARGAQLPLIFGPTEARRVKKKFFKTTPHPTPPYLKVWICQWSVWKNVRTPSLDVPLYWTLIILLNIMVVWQTVSCLSFLLGTAAIIIIWYRIYNLNSYQLCWRQRFFAKKLLMS